MGSIPIQTEPENQSIPIMVATDPVPFTPTLSPQIQAIKANKAAYGINMPENEMQDMFAQGRENEARFQASAQFRDKNADVFQGALRSFQTKTGRTPTTEDINQLTDALIRQQKLYNPESVFEYATSKKAWDAFQWGNQQPGRWWMDYKSFAPYESKVLSDLGEQFSRNYLILNKQYEEAKAAYDESSWAGFALDKFMNFASFGAWNEAYQRGHIPESEFGLLPGTDRENQRKTLMSMSPEELTTTLSKAKAYFEEKGNPYQYMTWITQMMGAYSPSELNVDAFLNAAFIGAPLLKGLVGAGVAGAQAYRGLKNPSGRVPASLSRELAKEATKDMAVATTGTVPMKIAVPAATNNIEEAAVQSLKLKAEGKFTPLQDVQESLPSGINVAREGLGINPNHREVENRWKEWFNIDALMERLRGANRVERVPAALETEENIRKTKDIMIDQYKGSGNHVMDVTQKGPIVRDDLTNTHWFEMVYGKDNATYWDHPDNAYEHAVSKGMHVNEWEKMERALVLKRELTDTLDQLANRRLTDFPNFTAYRAAQRAQGVSAKNLEVKSSIEFQQLKDRLHNVASTEELEKKYLTTMRELSDIRNSPGVDIRNDGQGFYISKWVPLPETHGEIRDMLLSTPNAQTPDGFGPRVMRNLMMGGETFSTDLNANAITATYGANHLHDLFLSELNQISKNYRFSIPGLPRWRRWQRYNQWLDDFVHGNLVHPETGKRGHIPDSSLEFESYYTQAFGDMPREAEVKAFWAAVKYVREDKAARQIHQFTSEARQGAELHRIELTDPNTGKKYWSDWFVGIDRSKDGFPTSSDGTLLIKKREDLLNNDDVFVARSFNRHTVEDKKLYGERITTGQAKSIELLYPNEFPLKTLTGPDTFVDHIVGSRIETKRLTLRDVPDIRAEYDNRFAIKQADVRFNPASKTWNYYGDKVVFHGQNKAQLEKYAKIMNEIKDHLHADRVEEASILARKLPFDFGQQHSWYLSGRLQTDPRLPMKVVAKGQQIRKIDNSIETSFENFKDRSFTRMDAVRPDPEEIYTLREVGTKHNPLWHYEPSKQTSAITMLNRSMNRIAKSLYWDDFRTMAVEHWMQEAKQWIDLEGKSPQFLEQSPHYFFYQGKLKADMPLDIKNRLESNRFKIRQLLGQPSEEESWIQSTAQKVADWTYETGGPKFQVDPLWMMHKVERWADASKSLAYHFFMGSFSPTQLLAQSANYATIIGMAKSRAIAGAGIDAGVFHQFSRMNEKWVAGQDAMLVQHSDGTWKPGWYTEARDIGMNTGLFKVGNEHTWKPYETGVIQSGRGLVADMGTIFWKAAERNQRFAAWYTAYLEARAEKPVGAFSNIEINRMVARAEQLTGSMSSAQRTWVQKGLPGVTTQFMGYGMRMAETMLGHRLTGSQKVTLFMTYFGLFGVGGFNLFGVPFGDMIRSQLVGEGYKPGEDGLQTAFNDGLLHGLTYLATGKSYNIGQRFSVGIDAIRELYDEGLSLKIVGGAPYNAFSQMVEGTNSLRTALGSTWRNDGKAPLKMEDLLDVFSPIKSISDARRYQLALSTTDWKNKSGQTTAENVSPFEALLMSITGVQRSESTSGMDYRKLEEQRKQVHNDLTREFLKNMNRYFDAQKTNDTKGAEDFRKKAMAVLTLVAPDKRSELMSLAASQQRGTVTERAEQQFRLRGVAPKELEKQRSILRRSYELKGQ